MDWDSHLAALRGETARFAAVLADRDNDLERFVGACNPWTASELVRHLGGVHLWAGCAVRTGQPADHAPGPLDNDLLHDWYQETASSLIGDLVVAGPERPCWTLTGPGTAAFWARRQALETLIHRWDAETSQRRRPAAMDLDLCVDGLDELITVLFPRQVQLGRCRPVGPPVRVASGGRSWVLGAGPAVATVSGPPDQLLLALWGRGDDGPPPLDIDGDGEAVAHLLRQAIVP